MLGDLEPRELDGRRALVRVDYNVPLDASGVRDATRIRATLPTLRHLLDRAARPVLMAHLGRPGGSPDPDLSLAPVAPVLERELDRPVRLIAPADSDEALAASRDLAAGDVILLENLRFLPGERENDPELSARLARLGDLYVNDAFGACHRRHASTWGVPEILRPAVAGLLVTTEVEALRTLREDPAEPFVVLLGGAKISDKIRLLEVFLDRADRVLVGGAMANTFLRARGEETGRSLVEDEALETAVRLLERGGEALRLPGDVIVAPEAAAEDRARPVSASGIPPDEMALDIGPATREAFAAEIRDARTVFWNGPMGLFERARFAEGTGAMARAMGEATRAGAFTVVGGGDSARAVREAGAAESVSHLSTGGGAALEYLAEGTLPGLEVLRAAPERTGC